MNVGGPTIETVATLEVAAGQGQFCTIARNFVVRVKPPVFKKLSVEGMFNQLLPPSVEACQFKTGPV